MRGKRAKRLRELARQVHLKTGESVRSIYKTFKKAWKERNTK